MRAKISDYRSEYMAYVDVLDDAGRRACVLRPFSGGKVTSSVDDGRRLWCLGKDRASIGDSMVIVLYDMATGAELVRRRIDGTWQHLHLCPINRMVALSFHGQVALLDDTSLQTRQLFDKVWTYTAPRGLGQPLDWQPMTRTEAKGKPGLVLGDTLSEGPDGLIRAFWQRAGRDSFRDETIDPLQHVSLGGWFILDPVSGDCRPKVIQINPHFAPLEFLSASPDGRHALRWSPQLVIAALPVGVDDANRHAFVHKWYLDLWSLETGAALRRIHVADMPSFIYLHNGASDQTPVQRLRDFADYSTRGKTIWDFPDQAPPGFNPRDPVRIWRNFGFDLREHKFEALRWEPDGQAFWVITRGGLRRIALDGSAGPLLFLDDQLDDTTRAALAKRPPGMCLGTGENWAGAYLMLKGSGIRGVGRAGDDIILQFYQGTEARIPLRLANGPEPMRVLPIGTVKSVKWPKLTAKDIGPELPGVVSIKGWQVAEIEDGLGALAKQIETNLSALRGGGDGLSLTFDVAGELLDEWAFFAKLREKSIDVTSSVRHLLRSFSDTIREQGIILMSEAGAKAGPMGGALDWLMMQTEDCADELRAFVLYRDGEHEKGSVDNLLVPYVRKRNYCDAQGWRLGILEALLYDRDGVSFFENGQGISSWVQSGVLPAARDRLPPSAFANHFAAEAAGFLQQPDVFAAFGTHSESLTNSLQSLDQELGHSGWDTACRAALGQHFPDVIDPAPLTAPQQPSALERFSGWFFTLWNRK